MSITLNIYHGKAKSKHAKLLNIQILKDENLKTIKEKLFVVFDGIDYYPPITKLEDDDGNVINKNTLLFNGIYVTNLIEEIEKNYDVMDIYTTKNYEDLYEKYKETYIDLEYADLEFVIKLLVLKNYQISIVEDDVQDYIEKAMERKEFLDEYYDNKQIEKFYDNVKHIDDYSQYFDIVDGEVDIKYTNVSFIIKGNNVINGVKGRFIKLLQIFNQLELSKQMPLLAIHMTGKDPFIKLYNNDNISAKRVRTWLLNEKKKQSIATYKKIHGLLVKYVLDNGIVTTINLMENGIIYCKVSFEEQHDNLKSTMKQIIEKVRSDVNEVIKVINNLEGIFSQPKRIDSVENSEITYDNISGTIETKVLLDKDSFMRVLYKSYVSKNIFEIKDTISEEILSMIYKKSERKGITVTLQDNPYVNMSSIINVYNAENVQQIVLILKQLIILGISYGKVKSGEQKQIKKKSHIKDLRKQGVNIMSTKCQKPRQPNANSNEQPLKDSYILEYKDIKYVCPSKSYPYPGFTNDNIVCCFKKDQRRRDAFLRNMKSEELDILVQPSNLKVKINKNNVTFDTYVIRVVSEYKGSFNEDNSLPRYFYITETNTLEPIANKQIIQKIQEEEQNVWLEQIPLTQIITEPPKNKCNFIPNMNNNNSDINGKCAHHQRNTVFGYNLNGYPCCFDKERDLYVKQKNKTNEILKQHILITDKLLDFQRIGTLQPGLNKLFNEILKTNNEQTFCRIGVVQNNASFFNALLLASQYTIGNKRIKTSSELRKLIIDKLHKEPNIFEELNMGNLILKYKSYERYIKRLENVSMAVYWMDYLDIIQRMMQINVIMLDIPYQSSESTITPDYNNIRIVCTPYIPMQKNRPCVILLKKDSKDNSSQFEVIISVNKQRKEIQYIFNQSESHIKFVMEYKLKACVKETVFPMNYPYKELMTLTQVQTLTQNTKLEIIGQIVNSFTKVNFAVTKKGVLLPVKETGIVPNLKKYTLKNLIDGNKLRTIEEYITVFKYLNKLNSSFDIKILGSTIEKRNGEIYYTSIMTNYGVMVPVKQNRFEPIAGVQVLDIKYYQHVDEVLLHNIDITTEEHKYNTMIKELRDKIHDIKLQMAKILSDSESLQKRIISINTTTKSRSMKVKSIVDVLKNLGITQDSFILQHIANEIINDNIENLLLNNLVTSDIFNPNEFLSRDSETLLSNLDELQKWIKLHE
jgi:hypothetical protein